MKFRILEKEEFDYRGKYIAQVNFLFFFWKIIGWGSDINDAERVISIYYNKIESSAKSKVVKEMEIKG